MVSWFLSLDFLYQILFVFCVSTIINSIFFILIIYKKNQTLNIYKRQLEKGVVITDESAAKVKVLESKIKVLEKALENALENK